MLKRVVATTSWTAAYAQAAGADSIYILAPIDMAHPAEYELRPSDVAMLLQAELIVFAGYEAMASQLQTGLGIPENKLLNIGTDYSYNQIESSVMKIAVALGNDSIAKSNLACIKTLLNDVREAINGLPGETVMVQFHVSTLVRELGITPLRIFGPLAPEAADIAVSAKERITLIIDNYHNPTGQVFKEIHPDARYVQLINFPGKDGTQTLEDVLRHNWRVLNIK
jgi:hypothetical protein